MKKVNILISYAYFNKSAWQFVKDYKDYLNLYIDSGAYTAFTKGKKVDIDEYQDFLIELDELNIDYKYFALDVIGDPERTWVNYCYHLNCNFDPIPIFTRGSNTDIIDKYYKHTDVIALGGISLKTEETPNYVKYLMERHIKGRKVHWLGWGPSDFVLYYKPHSVDSSNVSMGGRLGTIYYLKNNKLKSYDQSMAIMPAEVKRLIQEVCDTGICNGQWRGTGSIPQLSTYYTYLDYSALVKKRLGVNYYLVDTAITNLRIIMELFKIKESL